VRGRAIGNRTVPSIPVEILRLTLQQPHSKPPHSDLQVERIPINPLPNRPTHQLLHIPLRPHKPPVQKSRLGRRKPDGKLAGEIRYTPFESATRTLHTSTKQQEDLRLFHGKEFSSYPTPFAASVSTGPGFILTTCIFSAGVSCATSCSARVAAFLVRP
jgi:hypothetical protein